MSIVLERLHNGDMKTYATELKRRREAAGMTVRVLGDRIDRSATFVTDFELARKSNPPEPQVMTAFANVLGWPVSDQLRAWGYAIEGPPQALVNPFHRDDIRFRVVEAMKALDMSGPDGPFLTMFFRLKLRDLIDIGQYGVGEDGLSELVLDHETTQAG